MSPEELKEHEKQRLDGFARVCIGKIDNNGLKVFDVYAKGDEFAIYSTGKKNTIKDIRVRIDTKDPDDEKVIQFYQTVKGDFDKLKSISDKCEDASYSSRIAHALTVAMYGQPEQSKLILGEIYNDIAKEYKERVLGKLIYLSGSTAIALIICSIALYLYLYQPVFFILDKKPLYELILVSSMATLGGIVSVSRNINKITIDKGLGPFPYFVYGVERNVFAILGSIFIFFIIKSNLLFGFINEIDNVNYALLAIGFVSGFSETLVPNALKKVEENLNNEFQ